MRDRHKSVLAAYLFIFWRAIKHSFFSFAVPSRPKLNKRYHKTAEHNEEIASEGLQNQEYRYSHYQKSHKFALGGGKDFNNLWKITDCYAGVVLLLY